MAYEALELKFDPQTIKHLGVRMYSTLPPALAELISNAYDADSSKVEVRLVEKKSKPTEIIVEDNGCGLSYQEINEKFLVIGRNRRDDDGDSISPQFKRLATGKKGLGKLALFGLAETIRIRSIQNGKLNEFELDWKELIASKTVYNPNPIQIDQPTEKADGTRVVLSKLKRKSSFDASGLADSLSRIFIFDKDFKLLVTTPKGDRIAVDNDRKYASLDMEFEWSLNDTSLVPENSEYSGKIAGKLYTAEKPIKPSLGMRGITLYSRGKLVNSPEYFSDSTSSHFYSYLTGWISVDFIDELPEDVIATNRQSLDWDHPKISALRSFLAGIVSQVGQDWRVKRKEKRKKNLQKTTGIDTDAWINTLSGDVKINVKSIVETLGAEHAIEQFSPVIKNLHSLIPEYPQLHWRHLHSGIRERVKDYYRNQQFGDAASQAVQIYLEEIRNLCKSSEDGAALANKAFGSKPYTNPPQLQITDLKTQSDQNIQEGQGHLSRGIITGFRNPISHHPIDTNVPKVFSELDCLNILSLTSYLLSRLDNVTHNPSTSGP